ncbi:MAG: ROK family protein, partial [Blastocatellia bacterium]
YNGSSGFASEFGHMTMDPEGELCRCGNRGCWETQVSQAALFRRVKHHLSAGAASVLTEMVQRDMDNLTVDIVVSAARTGDPVALSALEHVGRCLGIGIASLVNALNPSLVVFGGILSLASDYLIPRATEELHHRALHWNEETARIAIARFGSEASVMGGVAKIFQTVLSNPSRRAKPQTITSPRMSQGTRNS